MKKGVLSNFARSHISSDRVRSGYEIILRFGHYGFFSTHKNRIRRISSSHVFSSASVSASLLVSRLFQRRKFGSEHEPTNRSLPMHYWVVSISRHGGHVSVQNNAVKCLLGIWLHYHAKTCGTIFCCFVHQHGCLIKWMKTKDILESTFPR